MVSVLLPSDALLQHLLSYLGFSYLEHGYVFTATPASTASALYLGRGVSPHCRPSWPWTWSGSLGPPVPTQPPLLGRGVAPLGSRPWPRTWVAPLGRSCAVSDWYSRPLPVTTDMGYLPYFTSVIHHGKAFRECCRNLRLIIKCAYSIIIFSNWKIHMFTYL